MPSRLSNGRTLPLISLQSMEHSIPLPSYPGCTPPTSCPQKKEEALRLCKQQPDPSIISTASVTIPNTAPLGQLQRKITLSQTDTAQTQNNSKPAVPKSQGLTTLFHCTDFSTELTQSQGSLQTPHLGLSSWLEAEPVSTFPLTHTCQLHAPSRQHSPLQQTFLYYGVAWDKNKAQKQITAACTFRKMTPAEAFSCQSPRAGCTWAESSQRELRDKGCKQTSCQPCRDTLVETQLQLQ